ncbi:MAG: hypothetical protein CFH19_01070 [Alphaproteobacteria bacterium MarineAlpha5_Bin9]|nr:MAG: hypothetical protein CFH19_01070 [Alphaproteobacteria bacterium MarineAlpha5_Bin9]|tara:strand:- start:8462 stop:9532 length:1071 start_codon:yes stop_codon:yes gene_type:complete
MKKNIYIFFLIFIIIISICFFFIFNYNIENYIEKKLDIEIEKSRDYNIKLWPSIKISNNKIDLIKFKKKTFINDSNIEITKEFNLTAPFKINLNSPLVTYKGLDFTNFFINLEYLNNQLKIKNLSTEFDNGKILINGETKLDDLQSLDLFGNIKNISINNLLRKLELYDLGRYNIQLSSNNFEISGILNNKNNSINNLKGIIPIKGSLFFSSNDNERFSIALLNLLIDKISDLSIIAYALEYIISNYADIPSDIIGNLYLENEIILFDKIIIVNEFSSSIITGKINYKEDKLNIKIDLKTNNKNKLEISLDGKINNPFILIKNQDNLVNTSFKFEEINEIFKNGINKYIELLLNND